MKKIILVPDSFKGSLSSVRLCEIMTNVIHRHLPACRVLGFPAADGGEGTVDCFLTASGGEKIFLKVQGPFFEETESFYGILPDKKTAVIEMAACAGLPLAKDRPDPEKTTTFGVGKLMLDAVEKGCTTLIVGLGGSCTNDAGCGAAAAAGTVFYDESGKSFVPVGGTLSKISRIDNTATEERFRGVNIIAMCDIDNPLYGKNGAAYVFAPQKGADADAVARLDGGLRHVREIIKSDMNKDVSDIPGGGAAGGLGAGMAAFFGAGLRSGIDTVLDTVNFDCELADADIVFTGEGRLDTQSLRGKVVIGVSERAKAKNVPVVAVVGQAENDIEEVYDRGVSAVFTVNRKPGTLADAMKKSEENFTLTFDNIIRLLLTGKS